MTAEIKSWFKDNHTLLFFLAAQAIAIVAYSVKLEGRVTTLETRGSPHLSTIDNRLTVLEKQTEANKEGIDRIVEVMTKRLNINP